jgi:hypothetical protein
MVIFRSSEDGSASTSLITYSGKGVAMRPEGVGAMDVSQMSAAVSSMCEQKEYIAAHVREWADEKICQIESSLNGDGVRPPITPRQAAPGRKSMYDHLQELKQGLIENPEFFAAQEIQRIDMSIAAMESKMAQETGAE